MLKQQLEALLQENAILKRAVSIQHERQKEFEERGQELNQLKQLVSQYQEQLRTLEVRSTSWNNLLLVTVNLISAYHYFNQRVHTVKQNIF